MQELLAVWLRPKQVGFKWWPAVISGYAMNGFPAARVSSSVTYLELCQPVTWLQGLSNCFECAMQLSADQLDFIIADGIYLLMPSTAGCQSVQYWASHRLLLLTRWLSENIFAPFQLGRSSFFGSLSKEAWLSVKCTKVVDWSDRATSVLFKMGWGVLLKTEKQYFWAESQFTDGLRGQFLTCVDLLISR